MISDNELKKGDKVKYQDKVYEISHSVMKSHEKICIWLNRKNKSWDMVDRKFIEKVN